MKKYVLTALAMGLIPAAASAETADNFNGGYLGVQAGLGKRSIDLDLGLAGAKPFKDSGNRLEYGVYAGYDVKTEGNLVIGAEVGLGFGGKKLSAEPYAGLSASTDPSFNYDATIRVGVAASSGLLLYARGGYGGEKVTIDAGPTGSTSRSVYAESGWSRGAIFGAGIEVALGNNMSSRLEYRRRNMKGSYSGDQILLGVGYNF